MFNVCWPLDTHTGWLDDRLVEVEATALAVLGVSFLWGACEGAIPFHQSGRSNKL